MLRNKLPQESASALRWPGSLPLVFLVVAVGVLIAGGYRPAAAKIISTPVRLPANPAATEQEFQRLQARSHTVTAGVDKWIDTAYQHGIDNTRIALSLRVKLIYEASSRAYEDFLERNPEHTTAQDAYAQLEEDMKSRVAEVKEWEEAQDIDPQEPDDWNRLAHYYGHVGPIKKVFECYAKAIELDPGEPVYYQNLANSIFLYRSDAKDYFQINEQQVFDRALELHYQARKLDPDNFDLASDLAQTYYGIKPERWDDAVSAWAYVLPLARNDLEREGIYLQLGRVEISARRFEDARRHLDHVHDETYNEMKVLLLNKLVERAASAASTKVSSGGLP